MDINWYGHSCFSMKGKEATVVCDPYEKELSYKLPKLKANIVTISHDHPGHNRISGIDGDPKIVRHPGEYEIRNVFIMGLSTFHDSDHGANRGRNIIYIIEVDDVRVCHLGDLGHKLSAQQIEEISEVGVLFIPVGGVSTIDAKTAAELVRLISPKIVVPMHYATDVTTWLEPIDKFVMEMGLKEIAPQSKISVTASNLPPDTRVTVLDYRLQ